MMDNACLHATPNGKHVPDRPSLRLPGRMRASVSGSQECARRKVYAIATGMKMRVLAMSCLVTCHLGLQIICTRRGVSAACPPYLQ